MNQIVLSGVRITLSEYRDLAAINRDDLVLWESARLQRQEDELDLAIKGSERLA